MQAGYRQRLLDQMSQRASTELEQFFISHGLGAAFARPGEGWGRAKRVHEALLQAEKENRMDEVLRAAAARFGGATSAGEPAKPAARIALELQELLDDIRSWDTWVYADVAETWQATLNGCLRHLRVIIGETAPNDFQLAEREYSSSRKTINDQGFKRLGRAVERALATTPASPGIGGPHLGLRLNNLHPFVLRSAKQLFVDGHHAAAIFEAFKSVNNRVKRMSGLPQDGKPLMASAFREERPIIQLNEGQTQSERDEQEGFKLIFMGAMQGIRNPKAHDEHVDLSLDRALEYMAVASLLMRRLDDAENE